MRARLQDIAVHAGVSEATVSRVVNGKPGVADATRRAVLAAIDQLGYEAPKLLRTRSRAGLIGLIVPELDNPVFPAFAQSIEDVLAQHGYTPVLCTSTPSGTQETEYVEMLRERGVAGIIFVSGLHADSKADHAHYRDLVASGLPIVMVNGCADDIDAPFFSNDDTLAMELAVRHLSSLGHRRIGCAMGPARFVPSQRKAAAYERVMRELTGDVVDDLLVFSVYSVEGGYAAMTQLLDRGVTAVVAGSDMMALGAIRAVRQRGLLVPRDVSVVGFDDSPLIPYTDPPLTTVRQPVHAMGAAAAQALLDEIRGMQAHRGEFLFRPELVVRGSSGPVSATPPVAPLVDHSAAG